MVSNPYHFSRLGTTVSAQITDGTDAPHTGLIKALSVYSSGSYPVKTSSDFDITAASANTINITSGKVVRDGELQAAITAGSGLSIGDTSAGKTYSLVVVNSSNAFAVRTTTTDNIVPEMSNGDIPIALVLYTSIQSTMEFQYFTNRKESNTLLSAYANSNVYTEILEIKGNAGNVELTGSALTDISSLDSANDRLLVRDAANNQLKLVAPNSVGGTVDVVSNVATNTILGRNDAGSGDSEELTPAEVRTMLNIADGATAHADADAVLAIEAVSNLNLTGILTVANGVVFNEAGASVDFRVETNNKVNMLVVDGSQDGVGINVAAPNADFMLMGFLKQKVFVFLLLNNLPHLPLFNTYDITDEDYIIIASLDPIGNDLTLTLPSASLTRQGQIYRLILSVNGTGSLKLDVQSGDALNDNTRSPLTTPYELLSLTTPTGAAGDIWEVICLDATGWMAYKL